MLKLVITGIVLLSLFAAPLSALKCLECSGVSSDEECRAKGKIRQCRFNEDACEIELRRHEGWGHTLKIYKHCKQSKACDDNHVQNPRAAWMPSQCNPESFNSVCRCCCYEDECNVARDSCFGTPGCGRLPSYVHHGSISCTNGRNYGSSCTVSCNSNSRMSGIATTYCRHDGYWSYPVPQCLDVQCPPRRALVNGWYICTNNHMSGSACSARCRPGFRLTGPIRSSCMNTGRWNYYREPRCIPLQCPPRGRIDGGVVECSDKRNLQSRCQSSCTGFRRLTGVIESYCQDNGKWSHALPTCELIQCPVRGTIKHGDVSCSLAEEVTSICQATCNVGYTLVGVSQSSCLPTAAWSEPLPRCVRTQCPNRGLVLNGKVSCSDSEFVGSICTVTCDLHAQLIGLEISECLANGEWDVALPVCQRIECPVRGTILNGEVFCTNWRFVGSVCTAECVPGLQISGVSISSCLPSGEWSVTLPSCELITCPLLDFSAEPGFMICDDEFNFGSTCTFTCNTGVQLFGSQRVRCQRNGRWTANIPSCRQITCPPRGLVRNGVVSCFDGNNIGSNCGVTCNVGFELVGISESSCLPNGRWSVRLPQCQAIFCPPRGLIVGGSISCSDGNAYGSTCTASCLAGARLEGFSLSQCIGNGRWSAALPLCLETGCAPRGRVQNGFVSCSDDNDVGSECSVTCNIGFQLVGSSVSNCLASNRWSFALASCEPIICPPRGLVIGGSVTCTNGNGYGSICTSECPIGARMDGFAVSECLITGRWSVALPTCLVTPCENQGTLEHGSISCTNSWNIQSTCNFRCEEEGYQLYPAERDSNVCRPNQLWNVPKPCCARPCPPYAVMDIVLVLDSSSSIGAENWVSLTNFVRGIIRSFVVAPDAANFAIFRYNRNVDTETQIFLDSHPGDMDALINSFGRIPYDGSGTFTGRALQHALDVSLAAGRGNRPGVQDIVFVITDGKAADDVKTPADGLRAMGATMLVLGIEPPRGRLDVGQLQDIAGGDENLVIASGGFEGLDDTFSLRLSRTICGEPCK
ncbi:P-selectin-like [Styela clava]